VHCLADHERSAHGCEAHAHLRGETCHLKHTYTCIPRTRTRMHSRTVLILSTSRLNLLRLGLPPLSLAAAVAFRGVTAKARPVGAPEAVETNAALLTRRRALALATPHGFVPAVNALAWCTWAARSSARACLINPRHMIECGYSRMIQVRSD
jgi:hypothetical protein